MLKYSWAILLVLTLSDPALAYMGPGAGLTFIGSLVALVSAVFAGIFGFIWFPIKRMMKKMRASKEAEGQESE